MKRNVTLTFAIVLLLVTNACGDSDDDGASTSDASTAPSASEQPADSTVAVTGSGRPADSSYVFTIDEVALGPDGYVRLRNFASVSASPKGLFLCQPPKCLELPNVEVGADNTAFVAASDDADLPNTVATWSDLSLSPADGEVGIYASENTDDPDEVRAYLQWGSTPHEGTEAAIAAGLWVPGYAPSSVNATRLFQNDDGLWLFEE